MLDGFDFTILTFVLADIQRSFTVDNALAGALGTVTLMFRLVGGAAAGTAADRWGRKLPLMLSIIWFSLFTVLSGFSTSYAMLFACRALFGIGMGGEWAAGMPLALEHLPDRMQGRGRGHPSGRVGVGLYLLGPGISDALYPLLRNEMTEAWRGMFWIGAVPAVIVLWIRAKRGRKPRVAGTQQPSGDAAARKAGIARTHLRPRSHRHDDPLLFARRGLHGVVLLRHVLVCDVSAGPRAEHAALCRRAECRRHTRIGVLGRRVRGATRPPRRGDVRRGARHRGVAALLDERGYWRAAAVGAVLVGFGAHGMWGAFPSYVTERFPSDVRGAGAGFCYHAGALWDRSRRLPSAIWSTPGGRCPTR